jgi:hypothetical protein
MAKKKYIVVPPDGTECPRCFQEGETRQHIQITQKQLNQPFYFKRWYNCNNEKCPTTIFMLNDWKVENKNAAALEMKAKQEYSAQLSFLKGL